MSKLIKSIKTAIEASLQRNDKTNREEIIIALQLMNVLLPQDRLYIIADEYKYARDFAKVLGRPFTHIFNVQVSRGLENVHIVILNADRPTQQQQENKKQILDNLACQRNITLWNIGEWL